MIRCDKWPESYETYIVPDKLQANFNRRTFIVMDYHENLMNKCNRNRLESLHGCFDHTTVPFCRMYTVNLSVLKIRGPSSKMWDILKVGVGTQVRQMSGTSRKWNFNLQKNR